MRLPFDRVYVRESMCGPTYVLSVMLSDENAFEPFLSFEMNADGSVPEIGTWNARDGSLRFEDDKGLLYFFSGLNTHAGVVFAVGKDIRSDQTIVMHEREALPLDKVGVCISTHVGYETAREKLLKSLRKSFAPEDIVVVEAGHKEKDGVDEEVDGTTVKHVSMNRLGFTALEAIDPDKKDFWLLLHDTCDVEPDVGVKLAEIDVGLKPDIVLFKTDGEKLELGLYSSSLIKRAKDVMRDKPSDIFNNVRRVARCIVYLDVSARDEGEKDVYGTGVKRRVLAMPTVGITKFRGKRAAGAKP